MCSLKESHSSAVQIPFNTHCTRIDCSNKSENLFLKRSTNFENLITSELNSIDLKGNVKWKKDFGGEWKMSFPGTRSTPTLIDKLLYVASGTGILLV